MLTSSIEKLIPKLPQPFYIKNVKSLTRPKIIKLDLIFNMQKIPMIYNIYISALDGVPNYALQLNLKQKLWF